MPRMGVNLIVGSLALNVLSVALPVVILQTYDRVVPNEAMETLAMLIFGLAVVLVLDSALRAGRNYLTAWEAAQFEHKAGCRAVDRLLSANVGELEREAPGVHLDRLLAIETLRDFHSGQAKLLMVDLPFVTIFLALIAVIAGWLVIVPAAMLVTLLVVSFLVGRNLRAVLERRAELDDRRYSFIIEVLSAIHTIKSLAFEAAMQRRYERLQEAGAALTYRVTFLNNLSQGIGQVMTYATMVAIATAGAVMVIAGNLTVGGLAASTLLAGRTVQPLLRALNFWTQFQNIVVARDRAHALFDTAPESRSDAAKTQTLKGAFELRDASFRYDDDSKLILDGLNLKVGAGEVIGIKGEMGCGKTTLLMLIMNALKPTTGEVLYDGAALSDHDPQSLRRQIGYMPQSAVLFHGTILENLTMFRVAEFEGRALDVCRSLGIDHVINRLPAGFETVVGATAENELSVGLRQGIAMARVLVANPRLLLFDEANAALDAKTDTKLKDALSALKGESTMILVSHRPSILALADRVYSLTDGRLVEQPQIAPDQATAAKPDDGNSGRQAPPSLDSTGST